MTVDNQTLAAMARLQHDKSFMQIVGFLKSREMVQSGLCRTERDTINLHRAQGAAGELAELIGLCESARTILELRQQSMADPQQKESSI